MRAIAARAALAQVAILIAVASAQAPNAAAAIDDKTIKAKLVPASAAIAALNAQRAANGIPGDLADNPSLSQGCLNHTTAYKPKAGQYPHTEIVGQPGYSESGAIAAGSSNLGGRAWYWDGRTKRAVAWWSGGNNPWSNAPVHLAQLFDPSAMSAWYGESRVAGCMGTKSNERQYSAPTFYSVPGNGRTDVPISQTAYESPWVPQQIAGIAEGIRTGPNLMLYPQGLSRPKLGVVRLRDSAGSSVAIAVVDPESPTPAPSDSTFPSGYKIGDYSRGAAFVIPRKPLRKRTKYFLKADWSDAQSGSVHSQDVWFQTSARSLEAKLPVGSATTASGLVVRLASYRVRPAGGNYLRLRVVFKVKRSATLIARIRGRQVAKVSARTRLVVDYRMPAGKRVSISILAANDIDAPALRTWTFN